MKIYEGPTRRINLFYSDGSGELNKAVKLLGWNHGKSVVGLPVTNARAEHAVKRIINGTKAALEHAGFEHGCWSFAAPTFCFNRLACVEDGDSIYNMKFQKGHIDQDKLFPFGCLVDATPTPDWAKENIRKLEPSTVPGVFLG